MIFKMYDIANLLVSQYRAIGWGSLVSTLLRAVCIPPYTIVRGGRVRRQRYTGSTLTVGSLYQAACDRSVRSVHS